MAIVIPAPLNRLRASISISTFPVLNVTSTQLGKRGISMTFSGDATTYIPTMVTQVTSSEPYLPVSITAHLVKTLPLANAYKAQMELASLLGGATIRADAQTLQPWKIFNLSIQGVDGLDFSGADADYTIRLGGFYFINASIYGS